MEKPEVSIVIPVYNGEQTIQDCLNACFNQICNIKFEIIVVNDGSKDKTIDILTKFPIRYFYQENSGAAAARNLGWRNAFGKIICFTDADCIPQPNWLSILINGFSNENIAGVGGTYITANKSDLLANIIQEEIAHRHSKMKSKVNFLGTFNVAYKKEVLELVNGFDPKAITAEDNDLAYRIIKSGYELIFTKSAIVAHHHPKNVLKYLKAQEKHGYWRVYLYLNHPKMILGDSYGNLLDYIQPPLALCILGLIPLIFIKWIFLIWLSIITILLLLQIPMTVSILRKTGRYSYLLFVPLSFIRAFSRGIGMLLGMLEFMIIRKAKPKVQREKRPKKGNKEKRYDLQEQG